MVLSVMAHRFCHVLSKSSPLHNVCGSTLHIEWRTIWKSRMIPLQMSGSIHGALHSIGVTPDQTHRLRSRFRHDEKCPVFLTHGPQQLRHNSWLKLLGIMIESFLCCGYHIEGIPCSWSDVRNDQKIAHPFFPGCFMPLEKQRCQVKEISKGFEHLLSTIGPSSMDAIEVWLGCPFQALLGRGGLGKETITTVGILPSHWPCDQRLRYLDFAQEMSGSAGVIWPQLLGAENHMEWRGKGRVKCYVQYDPIRIIAILMSACTIVYKYFLGRLVFWPLKWRSNSHRIPAGNTTKLELIWWHRVAYLSTPVYLRLFVYLFIIIYPCIDPFIHLSISLSIKKKQQHIVTYSIIREYIVQN